MPPKQRRRRRANGQVLEQIKKAVAEDPEQFLALSLKVPAWAKLWLFENPGPTGNVNMLVSPWIEEKVRLAREKLDKKPEQEAPAVAPTSLPKRRGV